MPRNRHRGSVAMIRASLHTWQRVGEPARFSLPLTITMILKQPINKGRNVTWGMGHSPMQAMA